jgi:hypothetical protein
MSTDSDVSPINTATEPRARHPSAAEATCFGGFCINIGSRKCDFPRIEQDGFSEGFVMLNYSVFDHLNHNANKLKGFLQ